MKLIPLILNELSEKAIQQLIEKFSKQTTLNPQGIRRYIERFKQIQNSPNVTKKDPFEYTWKEFEQVVDANRKEDTKAGKIDPTIEDANLLYNRDGIRVYVGKDKKACIKYGNGYSFCISARGEDNMYDDYTLGFYYGGTIPANNTPYFVFNDNLSSKQDSNKNFIDPEHLIVLFVGIDIPDLTVPKSTFGIDKSRTKYADRKELDALAEKYGYTYKITKADNQPGEEVEYTDFKELSKDFPWLRNLKHLFKPIPPSVVKLEIDDLKYQYERSVMKLGSSLYNKLKEKNIHHLKRIITQLGNESILRKIQNPENLKNQIENKNLHFIEVTTIVEQKLKDYEAKNEDKDGLILVGSINKLDAAVEKIVKERVNEYHGVTSVDYKIKNYTNEVYDNLEIFEEAFSSYLNLYVEKNRELSRLQSYLNENLFTRVLKNIVI